MYPPSSTIISISFFLYLLLSLSPSSLFPSSFPSLPLSLPPSLPPSLPLSLPPSLPLSLPLLYHFYTPSLPPSLSHSLPLSLPLLYLFSAPSLFPSMLLLYPFICPFYAPFLLLLYLFCTSFLPVSLPLYAPSVPRLYPFLCPFSTPSVPLLCPICLASLLRLCPFLFTFSARFSVLPMSLYLPPSPCPLCAPPLLHFICLNATSHPFLLQIVSLLKTHSSYATVRLFDRVRILDSLVHLILRTDGLRLRICNEGKIEYDDHCRSCHKLFSNAAAPSAHFRPVSFPPPFPL